MSVSKTGALFADGLDQISQLYIRPVSSRGLALAALSRLARLDDKLTVSELAEKQPQISLAYAGHELRAYPEPAGDDPQQWGVLLGRIVCDAKSASPTLATLSPQDVDKALFDGITGTLDRFSRYASAEIAGDQRAARDGFGGVGVTLDNSTDQFRVSAVDPGGPAAQAGIAPEDRIVKVDGIATAGRPESAVVHELRGPVGSRVELTVQRPGNARERTVQLTRSLIVLPTVTETDSSGIALFRIASFNKDTSLRVAAQLRAAESRPGGLHGIVLDLRDNPGGLLEQAVGLADLFIRRGPIVATVGRHPASNQDFTARGDSIAPDVPMVVLVNGASASSAEIVTAALQDTGRAVVVGTASYGKGTVQTVLRLPNDGELTLTWALLVTPSGYLLHQHGVVPTVCTSDLKDDPASLQTGLQRAAAAASPSRPRAALDEAGWSQLRGACPGKADDNPLDLKLAKRLLADPALYAQAVHALPATAKLVGAAAGGVALTAAAERLSSTATAH